MTFRKADWLYLLAAGLVVLGVSIVSFLLTFLTGDPAEIMLPPGATAQQIAKFRAEWGFDDPLASDTDCLRCHVIGQSRQLSDRHPKRRDCARCHRRAQPDEAGRPAPIEAAWFLTVAEQGRGVHHAW